MGKKETPPVESAHSQRSETVCPKCDGQMKRASFEITNSLMIDLGHALSVGPKRAFYVNPRRRSPICVVVCENCGFIESYAVRPWGL